MSLSDAAVRRLNDAGIALGPNAVVEVTELGLGRVPRVNEAEYASAYLTLEPGQEVSLHAHPQKKKTLLVLAGEVSLWVDGQTVMLTPGEHYTVSPGVRHALRSLGGAVLEEVSTHAAPGDLAIAEGAAPPAVP